MVVHLQICYNVHDSICIKSYKRAGLGYSPSIRPLINQIKVNHINMAGLNLYRFSISSCYTEDRDRHITQSSLILS